MLSSTDFLKFFKLRIYTLGLFWIRQKDAEAIDIKLLKISLLISVTVRASSVLASIQ
jgi:hypothetical protein